MGFLSTLFDVIVSFADSTANRVDKMSDDEIECRSQGSGRAASEYRDMAATAHALKNRRENNNGDD